MTTDKRITFRLDEKSQIAFDHLKETMSKQAMVDMTDTQVIRACLAMTFNEVFDGVMKFEDLGDPEGK